MLPVTNIEKSWPDIPGLSFLVCYPCSLPWVSWFSVACYLLMVHGGAFVMQNYKPFNLRWTMRAWNLFLALFSFWGAVRTMPHLLYAAFLHNDEKFGSTYSVCADPFTYVFAGPVGFAGLMFIYSKFFEFFDTTILVLRKKPVCFLHWFHHATVLLYCWDAYAHTQPSGIWFIAMNYCVHSVMYFYYFLTACGIYPKWAGFVTTIQILQMFVGMLITFIHYYILSHTNWICYGSISNLHFAMAMYFSYFMLFVDFALRRYVFAPRAKSAKLQDASTIHIELEKKSKADWYLPGDAGKRPSLDCCLMIRRPSLYYY